jgi:putative transposase
LRRPIESAQYTSADYTQTLDDAGVLASVGSTGDAYDNAMAESFVDTFKTELIADRVWRTRSQLELAIVQYVGWFNDRRLHGALGDIPPAEFESRARPRRPLSTGARGRLQVRRRPTGSGSPAAVRHPNYRPVNQVTRPPRNPVRLRLKVLGGRQFGIWKCWGADSLSTAPAGCLYNL